MHAGYLPLFDLASGGMGRVELVVRRDGSFERLYARKRPHAALSANTDLQAQLLQEARVAGLIQHPNVVSVLDVGTDDDGPYFIMEWVDGVPLHRVIQENAKEGPMSLQLCLRVAQQVALGLHAAHVLTTHDGTALEVVHRDVSPHNILAGFDGVVRVTDFGIAKVLHSDKTATGILKGKLGYLSPEQLRFQKLDRRSDLFSLGVVLFELCTSRRLYSGGNDGRLAAQRILEEPPPALGEYRRDAPPELEAFVMSLLSKNRDERPDTAATAAQTLGMLAAQFIAEEGEESLGDYLEESFGDLRRARRTKIAACIQATRELTPGHVAFQPPSKPSSPQNEPKRPQRIQAGTVLAILISALALGITTWVALRQQVTPPAVETQMGAPPGAESPVDTHGLDNLDEPNVAADAGSSLAPRRTTTRRRSRRPRRRTKMNAATREVETPTKMEPASPTSQPADPVQQGWGAAP